MAATKRKRTAGATDSSTDEIDIQEESSSNAKKCLCVICGATASDKLIRDHNYQAMLQLYWATLGVDVKPDACKKCDLCTKCHAKVVEYYETNDIIVYFENYFKSLRLNLLKRGLKGMKEWEKKGHELTKIHQEIRERYGAEPMKDPEEDQIRQTLGGYKMETFNIIDSEGEEGEGKSSRNGIKIQKLQADEINTSNTTDQD